jgi:POT family proton-dependent oligopeptide transporter
MVLPAVGIALLIYLAVLTLRQDPVARKKMVILNILILASIVYWTLFFQLFSSANLFVERLVDQHLFGIQLTAAIFWGSESIFIIMLGPLFAYLWQMLANRGYSPSPISKFFWAISCAGIAFLILSASTTMANEAGFVAPYWIFLAYFILTIGELLLSPIGLSAVTTLAPRHLVGFMMGVWFVSLGFGGIFSGMIAKIASIPETIVTTNEKLAIYQHAFFYYACLAFIIAILLFFTNLLLKRWWRVA